MQLWVFDHRQLSLQMDLHLSLLCSVSLHFSPFLSPSLPLSLYLPSPNSVSRIPLSEL